MLDWEVARRLCLRQPLVLPWYGELKLGLEGEERIGECSLRIWFAEEISSLAVLVYN